MYCHHSSPSTRLYLLKIWIGVDDIIFRTSDPSKASYRFFSIEKLVKRIISIEIESLFYGGMIGVILCYLVFIPLNLAGLVRPSLSFRKKT